LRSWGVDMIWKKKRTLSLTFLLPMLWNHEAFFRLDFHLENCWHQVPRTVHEPVRFPVSNRAYNFLSSPNRPVFLVRGNRCGGGLGNPGWHTERVAPWCCFMLCCTENLKQPIPQSLGYLTICHY
jgi:hypothetical protein